MDRLCQHEQVLCNREHCAARAKSWPRRWGTESAHRPPSAPHVPGPPDGGSAPGTRTDSSGCTLPGGLTQLIEAGVDIDFPSSTVPLAGLDADCPGGRRCKPERPDCHKGRTNRTFEGGACLHAERFIRRTKGGEARPADAGRVREPHWHRRAVAALTSGCTNWEQKGAGQGATSWTAFRLDTCRWIRCLPVPSSGRPRPPSRLIDTVGVPVHHPLGDEAWASLRRTPKTHGLRPVVPGSFRRLQRFTCRS